MSTRPSADVEPGAAQTDVEPAALVEPPGTVVADDEGQTAAAAGVGATDGVDAAEAAAKQSKADAHVHFEKSADADIERSAMHAAVHNAVFVVVAALCGALFGLAMEKSRVFEPLVIRQQMVMSRFVMLKMFLGAMGTSTAVSALMSLAPWRAVRYPVRSAFAGSESPQVGRNALSLVVGGLLLGTGMSICGACPGMVIVQFGAWTSQAYLTLIGALVGNLLYGLLHDRFYKVLFPKDKLVLPLSVMDVTGGSYLLLAVPMVVAMAAACVGFEYAFPWRKEAKDLVQDDGGDHNIFTMAAWPPIYCGILIGSLQLPLLLFGHMLSGSGAYNALCAQLMCTQRLRDEFPYLGNRFGRFTVGNWWQVVFAVGAALGALASALLSHSAAVVEGVPHAMAFIGGAIMLIGARVAAGCTSGHGLTGSGLLLTGSLLAVACMFAGGIATAFVLKACGALENVF